MSEIAQIVAATARSDGAEYCTRCGSERDAASVRFCRRCGAPLFERMASSIEGRPEVARAVRKRAPWFVVALSVLSCDIFGFIWFGTSWADLAADERDPAKDPTGHALAVLVPVYGQFRVRAHFREINERIVKAGGEVQLDPRVMVALTLLAEVALVSTPFAPGPTGRGVALLVALVSLAFVVARGQQELNRYWALRDAGITQGVRVAETLALAIFGLLVFPWVIFVVLLGL